MELVVAFSVLTLLIIFVFNLIPSSVLAIRRGLLKVDASGVAHNLLDLYRNEDWNHLTLGTDRVLPAVRSSWGVEFHPRVQIRPVSGADSARVREVRVTVGWDFRSQPLNVTTGAHVWHAQ